MLLLLAFVWLALPAQRPDYTKMSAMVRSLVLEQAQNHASKVAGTSPAASLCAFIQIDGNADSLLRQQGAESLARFGNIHIAKLPLGSLAALSASRQVRRIEANATHHATLDTMAIILRADKAYQGLALPQAFTGRGVVVGVQDIGFDFTHPTFIHPTTGQSRIGAVWDMLAPDDGSMPVGAVYRGDEVLAQQHSADGIDQTHGTHTTGIAAGSGYEGAYRGVAYESDICLVANATTDNASLIPADRLNLYTYAMDALGFKYLFDYAAERGMPCVASFSEGSRQDFRGDDCLYYQVLDSLVGPGRILVASAGNDGLNKSFFRKPVGVAAMGSFVWQQSDRIAFSARGNRNFSVRLVRYRDATNDTLVIRSAEVMADTLHVDAWSSMSVTAFAYASAYEPTDTVMEVQMAHVPGTYISVELMGSDAEVCYYRSAGNLFADSRNPALDAGECTHSIGSPASAPAAICVGSTAYRQDVYTYRGTHRIYDMGHNGERTYTSSVGPTFDERIKPDVVAPGTNIISSYSSFYLEHHPTASDIVDSDKEHFDYQGRTYAWNYNAGTSMSTPAVAGAIALWLQACPTLSPSDVRSLLQATARRHDPLLTYPNNLYGYGEIDVYAGLLRLLNLDGITNLSHNQPKGVAIRPQADGVEMTFVEAPRYAFRVAVYAAGGQCVAQHRLEGGAQCYHLSLCSLPHGVYAVQVSTGERQTTGSQLIRH